MFTFLALHQKDHLLLRKSHLHHLMVLRSHNRLITSVLHFDHHLCGSSISNGALYLPFLFGPGDYRERAPLHQATNLGISTFI